MVKNIMSMVCRYYHRDLDSVLTKIILCSVKFHMQYNVLTIGEILHTKYFQLIETRQHLKYCVHFPTKKMEQLSIEICNPPRENQAKCAGRYSEIQANLVAEGDN